MYSKELEAAIAAVKQEIKDIKEGKKHAPFWFRKKHSGCLACELDTLYVLHKMFELKELREKYNERGNDK